MNIPVLVVGVLLLAFAAVSRGRGGPAWWFPPSTHWTPKVVLEIVPIFGLIALAAAFAPDPGSDGKGSYGVIYLLLLALLVAAAAMRVPRWVMPSWLRDDIDAKAERLKGTQPGPWT